MHEACGRIIAAVSVRLPLSYAVDAVAAVAAGHDSWADLWWPVTIIAAVTVVALVLASATLRRRTP